ncbi:MAG: hypothetical protein JJE52_18430, partial [Acidimicrobiia bacterium]|nr:hypothetical protein [Acidimicrobiia bacterium]
MCIRDRALGALHSRASVGAGAVAAIAAVGVVVAAVIWGRPRLAELARRVAPTIELSARDLGVVAVTLVVAVTSYAAINHARFGELFRLPYERQTYALMSEERQAVLAANGGSFFGLRFVPTTFLQYARPDALDLGRTFPFVGFASDTTVVGDVEFDTLDPTAGIPATMPLFVVAGAAGVWLVGRDVARRGRLAPLAVPLSGAAVGALTCLVFGYVAQRYQGDAMPFFLLASIPTFHAIAGYQGTRRRVLVAGTAVLGVWGIAVGLGLGILYQRSVSPGVPDELRAGLHSAQLTAARWVPGAELPTVLRGDALPAELPDGALFVLGACDGLYWGDARQGWSGVERTETSGRFTLDVEWPEPHPGATLPLVSSGTAGTANVLVAVEQADGSMRIGYVWDEPSGERQRILGRAVEVDRGSSQRLEIVFDPNNVEIRVEIDGHLVYEGYRFFPRPGDAVGTSRAGSAVSPSFGGSIERVPQPEPSLCHDIVRHTESAARGR